jgi:hypothetical protein
MRVKVQAFECREWKVTCGTHRQGKWFGQDHGSAKRWKHAHCPGATVDYLMVEELKVKIRKLFGRKVSLRIADIVTPVSWPAMQHIDDYRQRLDDARLSTDYDDVPPF